MRKCYLILAVLLVACGTEANVLDELPTLQPTVVQTPAPELELVEDVLEVGRLAYVGDDNNMYVLEAGAREPIAITSDASPFIGGSAREYQFPVWSAGGWLSYVGFEVTSGGPTRVTIQATQLDGVQRTLYESAENNYIYGFWSPVACDQGRDCGQFAYLVAGADQPIELRLAQVRSDSNEVVERLLGTGGPFYYSWSPDGKSMFWHVNGNTLSVIDVATGDEIDVLPDQPGAFQAPWWSPVDGRLAFVGAGDAGNYLVVADDRERIELSDEGAILSALAWSPDGEWVAYAEAFGSTPFPFDVLQVYPAGGGQSTVTIEGQLIWSYFWSPDSRYLAFVTLETAGGSQAGTRVGGNAAPASQEVVLAWNVADILSGEVRRVVEFNATRSQRSMFTFFDQFAQSHNIWSPDSKQIVYAEVLPDGDEVIRVINMAESGARPLVVARGSIAVFSYD